MDGDFQAAGAPNARRPDTRAPPVPYADAREGAAEEETRSGAAQRGLVTGRGQRRDPKDYSRIGATGARRPATGVGISY